MPVDASRLQIAPTSTRAHFDIESWQALRRSLGFEAGDETRHVGFWQIALKKSVLRSAETAMRLCLLESGLR